MSEYCFAAELGLRGRNYIRILKRGACSFGHAKSDLQILSIGHGVHLVNNLQGIDIWNQMSSPTDLRSTGSSQQLRAFSRFLAEDGIH